MAAESGHRLERRAATDAEPVRLLEQPLPEQLPVVPIVLADVEAAELALHDCLLADRSTLQPMDGADTRQRHQNRTEQVQRRGPERPEAAPLLKQRDDFR